MKLWKHVAFSALVFIFSIKSFAEERKTEVKETIASEVWSIWGITEADWFKYRKIMSGPRQLWSSTASPLSVLGAEATSESDRQRFAEIEWRMDLKRMEQDVAYQKAYNAARERWLTQSRVLSEANRSTHLPYQRAMLFTSVEQPCSALCQKLINGRIATDIYFIDGNVDQIRDWAGKNRIDPAKVLDKRVTLNISPAEYRRLHTGSTPVAYGVTLDNQIRPLSL